MVLKQSIVSTEEFKNWGLPNEVKDISDELLAIWLLQSSRIIDLSINNLVSRLDLLNPDTNIPSIVLDDIKQAVIELVNYFMGGNYAGDEQKVSQTFNNGIASFQRDADTFGDLKDAFPVIVRAILQNSVITLYEFNPDVSPQISPNEYLKKEDATSDNIKNDSKKVEGDNVTQALDYLSTIGIPEELDKHLDYSNPDSITIVGKDKKNWIDGGSVSVVPNGVALNVDGIGVVGAVKDQFNVPFASIRGKLDMIDHSITNVKDGVNPQDVVTKKQLDNVPTSKWNYDAEGNKIINVGDPTEDQDVLTKAYFDWNTLMLRKQVVNLDEKGEIIDDTYLPDSHPKRLVSQKVLKDTVDNIGSGLGSTITNYDNNLNLAHQNIQLDNLEIGNRILYRDYSNKSLSTQHIIIDNNQKNLPIPNLNTWVNEYDFTVAENGKYNLKQLFYYKLLFTTDVKKFRVASAIHNATTGVVSGQQEQDFDFSSLDNDKDIKDQVFNWFKETNVDLSTGNTYVFRMTLQGLDSTEGTFSPAVYTSAPHVYDLTEKSHLELSQLVEKGSSKKLPSYNNTNFQDFVSQTYPGDIDNTLRTITGWNDSLKAKTMFSVQSNGALVITEEYRKEIADKAVDRYVRIDFSAQGFTGLDEPFFAQVTPSGLFDFNGEQYLLRRTATTTGADYAGSLAQEVHSRVFRIPHNIGVGDLMFIEIKSYNCGVSDMRPPYHLTFTELGSEALKGDKGEKGDTGTSGSPKLGEVNNIMDSRNLATQNLVSNVGENLKEGGAKYFQSYQYATLPSKSINIDATERVIPFPKGTDAWEDEITFTPLKDTTYLFKNLYFFNLNPFTDDNKKFKISQKLTDKDGIEYTNDIYYDLNEIKNDDIQKNVFSNFVKFYETLDITKAPYTYKQTIQGLEGSTSSLLINTESSGTDPLYPSASHISIIEMLPSGDVFAYDKDVEVSDPNDYTYYGWDPKTGSNIISVLQYAMSEVEYSKLLGRVIKIGEDVDKNITKVLIESPVDIEVNNQKIVDLAPGVLDNDAVTVKQLKDAEIHLEKQSYKDIVSVDKFLLDAYSNTIDGFSRGVWKTADLGLIKTYESWVDGTEIVTDQLKLTLTNAITGGGTLPNGKEYFIDIKDIETSDTIQNKVMDDLTHEYNEETVSIKFNLRKNATNIFIDLVCYTEGTLVGTLNSIDVEIDLIKLKGVKSIGGSGGGVREVMYNETQTIPNSSLLIFNMISTGINSDFRNVDIRVDCGHGGFNIVSYAYSWKDAPFYRITRTNAGVVSLPYTYLEIDSRKNTVKISNNTRSDRDFKVYITGERI